LHEYFHVFIFAAFFLQLRSVKLLLELFVFLNGVKCPFKLLLHRKLGVAFDVVVQLSFLAIFYFIEDLTHFYAFVFTVKVIDHAFDNFFSLFDLLKPQRLIFTGARFHPL